LMAMALYAKSINFLESVRWPLFGPFALNFSYRMSVRFDVSVQSSFGAAIDDDASTCGIASSCNEAPDILDAACASGSTDVN